MDATPQQYAMSAASRMALRGAIGRDGAAAFDRILASLHAVERPKRKDVLAFCRALHDHGMIDFSSWPEFKRREFGARFAVRTSSFKRKS